MIENLKQVLPSKIYKPLETRLNYLSLYEIRLRADRGVVVNYSGKFYYLSSQGLTEYADKAIKITRDEIEGLIIKSTEYSLYAFNDNICDGYVTIKGGIRIGLAGEMVRDNESIKTIKNFNSVTIRIPHEVIGCAREVFEYTYKSRIFNTLIVSPPGAGKTTLLRDLARLIGNTCPITNVLLVDERNEIASCFNGVPQLEIGRHTDVISSCTKKYAFIRGVRALRPDVIITDELCGDEDCAAIEYAASAGVSIIASVHAFDCMELFNKKGFENVIKKRMFMRYVNLSNRLGPGTCDGIFDEKFECIYYK